MRDIEKYALDYSADGFEVIQESFRRKKILEILRRYELQEILDIGTGMQPVFTELGNIKYKKYTCIEPSLQLYENAKQKAIGNKKIECINDFFPSEKMNNKKYDFIICSSLLHEIENQEEFLEAIKRNCKKESKVYFCVPNANSFHRILAKRMGIIRNINEKTERNVELQQNNVFDVDSLKEMLEDKVFFIMECGTFFMKPFTHKQMYMAFKEKIIDEKVLEGLYNCSEEFSKNGSEIYMIAKVIT
ncbi:class I SAM-dependent methyltransferase [Treponema sp. OMZ 792]|uniref:class I SAM-dependent methyltransferase n=1 Tax=unclassified Treponema TaxID=2638727 RepID=UPI0020A367FD|nr:MULTISPECIES: class I SAM-dependent methyltransferase [unclassified Treponema]UTC75948.1 class I SAM-dependent methyltransferase [Treponema sp. OMZ 792]UTC75996.1 class I SAM-dependent methyltransferase [Treponema sp. OMZ 792]UTC79949.1 class I SAM-dependent methyltransferase [Treponema sp. OMZ 798]UTC79998.1 class I SAM-dependent methyltransferase [Treponema sp. OMZ 798]